jgi:hypothetical protein
MAYHWYDPGEQGSRAPVVWDDGNRGSSPRTSRPGERRGDASVKALPKPTKNAAVLVPFLHDVNFCPTAGS